MKTFTIRMLLTALLCGTWGTTMAQRADAWWVRSTAGAAITLDGNLNEAAWAKAEAKTMEFGKSAGLPGSGWREEGGRGNNPTDPMKATLKFLLNGNKLYMGVAVADSSVGGSGDWATWDAFLMGFKDKTSANRPVPAAEYFYTFWSPDNPDATKPGAQPHFIGKFGGDGWPPFTAPPRDATRKGAWDGVIKVDGVVNDDSTPDKGYVIEMMFDLGVMGYDFTKATGDVGLFSLSIWDADWNWPRNAAKFASNRTWWQDPWGNADVLSQVQLWGRPDWTINSTGSAPAINVDGKIPNAAGETMPTVDGGLTEAVWTKAKGMDIRYGDKTLRGSYRGVGPFLSGEFQPEFNGVRADVLDPGDATVKWFYSGTKLYVSADVRDQVLTGDDNYDMWDGFRLMLLDRDPAALTSENVGEARQFVVRIGADGKMVTDGYLTDLIKSGKAEAALKFKGSSTVNDANDIDLGYTVEMVIDLAALGYPVGDNTLFAGLCLFDGDKLADPAKNYSTRTWWFKEHTGGATWAWLVMDDTFKIGVANEVNAEIPNGFKLEGNYPNPFNPSTTIRYALPQAGDVNLDVFDVTGRLVRTVNLGAQSAGSQGATFQANGLASGVYLYQLRVRTQAGVYTSPAGKMILMK